jgi:hypothetical protein
MDSKRQLLHLLLLVLSHTLFSCSPSREETKTSALRPPIVHPASKTPASGLSRSPSPTPTHTPIPQTEIDNRAAVISNSGVVNAFA